MGVFGNLGVEGGNVAGGEMRKQVRTESDELVDLSGVSEMQGIFLVPVDPGPVTGKEDAESSETVLDSPVGKPIQI